MKQRFIRDTYAKAVDVMRVSDTVVAIGYSFNSHDRASYQTLLNAMAGRLLVVAPDADALEWAVRRIFPRLTVETIKATFKEWVASAFQICLDRLQLDRA